MSLPVQSKRNNYGPAYLLKGMVCVLFMAALLLSYGGPGYAGGGDKATAQKYLDRGRAALEIAKNDFDLKQAEEELKKSLAIAPNLAPANFFLGQGYERMNNNSMAINSYKRYLLIAPNGPYAQETNSKITKLEYINEKQSLTQRVVDAFAGKSWYGFGANNQDAIFTFSRTDSGQLRVSIQNAWDVDRETWVDTVSVPVTIEGEDVLFSYFHMTIIRNKISQRYKCSYRTNYLTQKGEQAYCFVSGNSSSRDCTPDRKEPWDLRTTKIDRYR